MSENSEPVQGVFLCPACHTFSEATLGEEIERACPHCGHKFSEPMSDVEASPKLRTRRTASEVRPVVPEPVASSTGEPEVRQSVPEKPRVQKVSRRKTDTSDLKSTEELKADRIKVHHRRKKVRWGRWVGIFTSWFVVVGIIAAYFVWRSDDSPGPSAEEQRRAKEEQDRRRYVNAEINKCAATLIAFLDSKFVSERTQEVLGGSRLVSEIDDYYKGIFEVVDIDTSKLKNTFRDLIRLPNGRYRLVSRWSAGENTDFEAVFESVPSGWKLDWQHFVRANSEAVSTFLASEEPKEGVFRLWVRERLPDNRYDGGKLRLAFVEPGIVTRPEEVKSRLWVDVQQGSDLARAFATLFDEGATFAAGFEPDRLAVGDPEGHHRVRVRLKVTPGEGQNGAHLLEVLEIQANHWLGDFDLGKNTRRR